MTARLLNSLQILLLFLLMSFSNESFSQEAITESKDEALVEEPFVYDSLIQKLDTRNLSSTWKKIVIVDEFYPLYLNTYAFHQRRKRIIVRDSIGKKICSFRKAKLDKPLRELVHQIHESDSLYIRGRFDEDPMKQFGLDSNWYKANIIELWDNYRIANSIVLTQKELDASSAALLDFKRVYRNLRFPNNWNKDEQAMIDLKIMYENDLIHLQATSYFPYMLS